MAATDAFTSETLPRAIKSMFEDNQYSVSGPVSVAGAEVDLVAKSKRGFITNTVFIEATIEYVDVVKYGKDLTKLAMLQRKFPDSTQLIVSSQGFTNSVRERALELGIRTYTFDELRASFSQFEPYLQYVLNGDVGSLARELNLLFACYEEPFLIDDGSEAKALSWLDDWLARTEQGSKWLIITGEYGTGKTALTKILQRRWSHQHTLNSQLPIPFRIELRDFSRQFDADGLLHKFLDSNKLGHIPLPFVRSLISEGRVLLILDGYDEMAQYLSARERRSCLAALASLSRDGARGILTSRPNYFSEAEELNIIESLYTTAANQLRLLGTTSRIIEEERSIDDLFEQYFISRVEKSLKDLDKAQSRQLVARRLEGKPEAQLVVDSILDKLFEEVSLPRFTGHLVKLRSAASTRILPG